jgi:hypothetical protein
MSAHEVYPGVLDLRTDEVIASTLVGGDLASALASELGATRDIICGGLAQDPHFSAAVAGRLDLVRDQALDLADRLASARDLAAEGEPTGDGYSYVDLDRAVRRADTLIGGLNRAHDLASDLASGIVSDLASGLASGDRADRLASDLADEIISISDVANDLARHVASIRQVSSPGRIPELEQRRARRVAPSAGRLLAVAARLLPAADRGRYAEEYRSELWEIARGGAGRRQQVRYAVSQLTRVAHLRCAVMTPRRRNASP